MNTELHYHFYFGFACVLAGLLLTLATGFKFEGISIQLFGGFASVLTAIAIAQGGEIE